MKAKNSSQVAQNARAQRERDVAAFDSMCADPKLAPRKPPPLRLMRPVVTAGQLELRSMRRRFGDAA